MTTDKTLKFDPLLFICVLFNIVNIIVFIQSLMNYSFLTITTVFIIGMVNILLASLMVFRIRKNDYKKLYVPSTCNLAQYYITTVFRGGLFIAITYAIIAVVLWFSTGMPGLNNVDTIHHCSASIAPTVNSDLVGFMQYSFDNLMCSTGNSRFFSFISINEDNFIIVVMNRLMETNHSWGKLWPTTLYLLLIVSLVPFVWMFARFVHIAFELFRKERKQV